MGFSFLVKQKEPSIPKDEGTPRYHLVLGIQPTLSAVTGQPGRTTASPVRLRSDLPPFPPGNLAAGGFPSLVRLASVLLCFQAIARIVHEWREFVKEKEWAAAFLPAGICLYMESGRMPGMPCIFYLKGMGARTRKPACALWGAMVCRAAGQGPAKGRRKGLSPKMGHVNRYTPCQIQYFCNISDINPKLFVTNPLHNASLSVIINLQQAGKGVRRRKSLFQRYSGTPGVRFFGGRFRLSILTFLHRACIIMHIIFLGSVARSVGSLPPRKGE